MARVPRASLGSFPTPVTRVTLDEERSLLIKRDDLTGARLGGNKVRALEWLLGAVQGDDEVLTVGPTGSTHALATATYAGQLGARVTVVRWPQEMNAAARRVDAAIRASATVVDCSNVVSAYAHAWRRRLTSKARWIPAGGTNALGILGYVNGAMELMEQVGRGEAPALSEIVVPLGTGGTAAGIALGLRIAGAPIGVRAVRVAPRVVASGARVMWLASRAARLIERLTGERLPRVLRRDLLVVSDYYAQGYGRPIGRIAEEQALSSHQVQLDDTYSRKTFAASVQASPGESLFWLTFDGRLLQA